MEKLTIFVVVVLYGVLRGFLQRRHVKAELEERMAKARNRPTIRRLPGRLQRETDLVSRDQTAENRERESA
jgi:hypothetical protein